MEIRPVNGLIYLEGNHQTPKVKKDIYDLDITIQDKPEASDKTQMSAQTVGCDISEYCNYTNKCK